MATLEIKKKIFEALTYMGCHGSFCPVGNTNCPFECDCDDVTAYDWQEFLNKLFSTPDKKEDSVKHPAHYTQYPVEVIKITAPLGFCLGNAVKYVLRAPLKGQAQDCEKAKVYLQWENQRPVTATVSRRWFRDVQTMLDYLLMKQGDVARAQALFMLALRSYLVRPSSHFCNLMLKAVDDLEAALKAQASN